MINVYKVESRYEIKYYKAERELLVKVKVEIRK